MQHRLLERIIPIPQSSLSFLEQKKETILHLIKNACAVKWNPPWFYCFISSVKVIMSSHHHVEESHNPIQSMSRAKEKQNHLRFTHIVFIILISSIFDNNFSTHSIVTKVYVLIIIIIIILVQQNIFSSHLLQFSFAIATLRVNNKNHSLNFLCLLSINAINLYNFLLLRVKTTRRHFLVISSIIWLKLTLIGKGILFCLVINTGLCNVSNFFKSLNFLKFARGYGRSSIVM